MKSLIVIWLTALALAGTALANPFIWTGEDGDGEWTNAANWAPVPNWSASNSDQNGYRFIFNTDQQTVQNLGNTTGEEETVRRYSRMEFSNHDYELNSPYGRLLLGSGSSGSGIYVDGVTVSINVKRFDFNVFTLGSNGEVSATNGGQLNLNVSDSFQIAGSSLRTLNLAGDGIISLSGSLQTGDNGGGILLKNTMTGTVVLNTVGSTIDQGDVVHRGTGVLELGADDAIGSLGIVFENAQAKIAAGNGNRTINAAVRANDGFVVAGSSTLTLTGSVDLNNSAVTIGVTEADGRLVLEGDVDGEAEVLTKKGEGVLELSGLAVTSFEKSLSIVEGEVQADGLVIHSSRWLTGSGLLTGAVSIDGQLRLQGSEGLTLTDNLQFNDGSSIAYQLGAGPVTVEGDLDFSGIVFVELDGSSDWQVGQAYRLFELEDGEVSGSLVLAGAFEGDFTYQSGELGYVEFELTAIPEPYQAAMLFGLVMLGVVGIGRMRRR